MLGASRPAKLDSLIESVARGERDLASIRDAKLRDAVRVALRVQMDTEIGLDTLARARMRDRVLGSLRPRPPTLADRVAVAFHMLPKPAPHPGRGMAASALCCAAV